MSASLNDDIADFVAGSTKTRPKEDHIDAFRKVAEGAYEKIVDHLGDLAPVECILVTMLLYSGYEIKQENLEKVPH